MTLLNQDFLVQLVHEAILSSVRGFSEALFAAVAAAVILAIKAGRSR